MGPTVNAAPEVMTEAPKKMSKVDEKRLRQRQERFLRTKNQSPGLTDDQVLAKMQQQDLDNMPIEKRFKSFEAYISQVVQQLAREINNLRHNDNVLAEAMDVNFKGFAKMLLQAGVSEEDQKKLIEEAATELRAEFEARQKAVTDAAEEQKVSDGITSASKIDVGGVDANGSPIPPPDGATVFGG